MDCAITDGVQRPSGELLFGYCIYHSLASLNHDIPHLHKPKRRTVALFRGSQIVNTGDASRRGRDLHVHEFTKPCPIASKYLSLSSNRHRWAIMPNRRTQM